ncbi:hypothetical protein V9K67_21565 [Paraflavisolibacter sp. H34]|uniref:hypothetical protein n=1 Tax=Huijunlia imazamoxiresistens TaxID=3127457 RepID=UPI00301AB38C
MVLHPLEKYRAIQAEQLAALPEHQRRQMELAYSFGNAAYIYHSQAQDYEPSEVDFEEWLEGLSETMRASMKKKGFQACKTHIPFTRYVLEKNDIGMDLFVKNLMGAKDYAEFHEFCNENNRNP